MFNKPSGIIQFKGEIYPKNETFFYRPVYMQLASSDSKRPNLICQLITGKNYTSCEDKSQQMIDMEGKNLVNMNVTKRIINRIKVKMVRFEEDVILKANKKYNEKNNITNMTIGNNTNSTQSANVEEKNDNAIKEETNVIKNKTYNYFYIADSANHCIRRLDYLIGEVTTYAGKCTEAGFKDGPNGINRLNSPSSLGIDKDGNLYIFDSGNRYMRMVDTSGNMVTLINGSCFEYFMDFLYLNAFRLIENTLLCFKKWVKVSGEPIIHLYDKIADENICKHHYVLCDTKSSLIYNRTLSLYDIESIYNYTADKAAEIFEGKEKIK